MVDRGFLPEFNTTVLAEVTAIAGPAPAQLPSVRDLRELLWVSTGLGREEAAQRLQHGR